MTAHVAVAPVRGRGASIGHHGEILQGVFADDAGATHAGLVTLPLPGAGTWAEFVPLPGDLVEVEPADRVKARCAAELAVRECARLSGLPVCGGRLRLRGDIPIGLGMGSSTSDVIAAVRAVASAFGMGLASDVIARVAVAAETASDPLMLDDRPVLFAQREGRVVEVLGERLPGAVVVGCLTGGGRPVDTLGLVRRPEGPEAVAAYAELLGALRVAIADGDVRLLGWVATESARRNQDIAAKDEFDALVGIARRVGGVGVQVAHSGNVAGVLFDPATRGLQRAVRRCVDRLVDAGLPVTRIFHTQPGLEGEHGRARRRRDRQAGRGTCRGGPRLPAV